MPNALTPALTVTLRATICRRRELPILGELLVKEGDIVSGDTIVARARLEGDLRLVRIADTLGVPPETMTKVVRVKEGDNVLQGDTLAEMRGLWGLFRSSVAAPISGSIEFISASTGHIGIRAPSKPLDLFAYIPGRVASIEPARSVVIEADATFVQGIFGVGGERRGMISMLPVAGDTTIGEEDIPSDVAGKILVGGHSPTGAALRKAAQGGAVGFVTGSIDDGALRDYVGYDIGVALTGDEDISMTLIITEGFGALPMSARVVETLRAIDGVTASVNGATQVRAGAQRPEIIAPAPPNAVSNLATGRALEVGARIRIIRVPYFGLRGEVISLPQALEEIETGASVRVLRARLENGQEVSVPRANVELL